MKKLLVFVFAAFCLSFAFAYNPPLGGEQLEKFSSATALTSASSSTGGALYFVEPHSIHYNPALTAFEQRTAFNIGGAFLLSPKLSETGGALQAGFVYPWKWFTLSADVRGVFSPIKTMRTGNVLGATFGLSKDVTDRLSLGLTVSGGAFWGAGNDWKLGAGIGMLYKIPYVGFLKNVRFAAALLNLGKNFTNTELFGINNADRADMFPGFATLRIGTAAVFYQSKFFEIGASLDLVLPSFQNFLTDIGVQMSFGKVMYVSIAEHINAREIAGDYIDVIPSVSIGWRIVFNSRKKESERSFWHGSELRLDGGWKYLYGDIHAFAANATLKIGSSDMDAPEVQLWGGQVQ